MTPAKTASRLARARQGAALGALATALILTGCSSNDDSDAKGGDSSPSASSSGSSSGSDSGGDSGTGAKDGTLEGSWVATTDGKAVALVIDKGGKAGLFDSGGNTCSGTGGDEMGMKMIHLKCTDGSDDRSEGMVKSVSATTLQISWEGFGDETYTKSKDGKLPEGLPTANLPKS